uniref:Photosystem I P700 chlorophyll a apoprotein A2 n=1 Tax=Picea glauca TaxID=3330 RepID=A0A101LX65_PICGL|nr:Photosystem I P700 chlorophyll a apoprotein A2 [Picea glauca]
MLEHKEAIIYHFSWAGFFLGFHTLGLSVHNDVMLAFGTPEKQILIGLRLINVYNLLMVRPYMVLMYSSLRQMIQH